MILAPVTLRLFSKGKKKYGIQWYSRTNIFKIRYIPEAKLLKTKISHTNPYFTLRWIIVHFPFTKSRTKHWETAYRACPDRASSMQIVASLCLIFHLRFNFRVSSSPWTRFISDIIASGSSHLLPLRSSCFYITEILFSTSQSKTNHKLGKGEFSFPLEVFY